MRLICILMLLTGTLYGQINPTTHLKPAVDTGYAMISAGTYNRYFPVSLYGYLRDTLAMDTSLSNELQTLSIDSNATTYTATISAGNNIKWAKSTATPDGFDKSIQYNESGAFGGDAILAWDYTNQRLGIGTTLPTNRVDIVVNAANILRLYSASGSTQTLRLQAASDYGDISVTNDDITYNTSDAFGGHLFTIAGTSVLTMFSGDVGLSSGVDLGFSGTSSINDNVGSTGSSGQYLSAGTGGEVKWAAAPTTSPGGSTTHVQFNNAGAFGGESTFTYNSTSNQLTVEDLYVTTELRDGANSTGTNLELLTTTGTGSRWKTVSMTASLGLLDFDLDGVTAATVDLSLADLSDAGSVENNNNAQDLHVTSLAKMTDWGTTPEFSGTGITWSSANERWTAAYSGKYEITFSVCMVSDATGDVCVQFWVYKNGSPAGVPYYASVQDTYSQSISHTVTLELTATDYVEVWSGRCDTNTAVVNFCSSVNGGIFDVKRINY